MKYTRLYTIIYDIAKKLEPDPYLPPIEEVDAPNAEFLGEEYLRNKKFIVFRGILRDSKDEYQLPQSIEALLNMSEEWDENAPIQFGKLDETWGILLNHKQPLVIEWDMSCDKRELGIAIYVLKDIVDRIKEKKTDIDNKTLLLEAIKEYKKVCDEIEKEAIEHKKKNQTKQESTQKKKTLFTVFIECEHEVDIDIDELIRRIAYTLRELGVKKANISAISEPVD